jgi:hypothetical protein
MPFLKSLSSTTSQLFLVFLFIFLSFVESSNKYKIGNYIDIENTVSRTTQHELIDLKELYHIWKPIIEQVGYEALAQLQAKESVELRSIETTNAQIANGVYYHIRLELDQAEQIELTMLDHDDPHFMWLPSDDPRVESSQETRPLLPRMEFRGPMELIFPASREVRMKLPRYVDAGSFRKLILEKGAHVNTSGFVEATLMNALIVNNLSLMVTNRPSFEELQRLAANGLLGNTFTHKLILSLKNIPKIMLTSDVDFKPAHSVNYLDDGSSTGVNYNSRDAVFESDELLKVKRKSNTEIIVYNSTVAEQNKKRSVRRESLLNSASLRSATELQEGYEVEIPINAHLAGLLQQFMMQLQSANVKSKTIKKILSGKAEAVKCFMIPIRVTDASGEALWHVLAIKRITGQTVVLNVQKVPEVPDISISDGILQQKNETFTELSNQLASLVDLSLQQTEYRHRLPHRGTEDDTEPLRTVPSHPSENKSQQNKRKESSRQQQQQQPNRQKLRQD